MTGMHVQIPYHVYVERHPTKLLALYHSLRDAIVEGRLLYATRLPSTRELAQLYGLSRGTVNQAYDMLAAEGYVTSERGSGTFVAYRQPPADDRGAAGAGNRERGVRLSAWGRRVAELPWPEAAEGGAGRGESEDAAGVPGGGVIDFGRFAPDVGAFPREAWSRCLYAQVRGQSAAAGRGERAEPLGHAALREAIAHYVRRARGIAARPEHVAVTAGSMQAIALLAQLLVGPGETAVAETPAFRGIRQAVAASGARCLDAPVDAHGVVPADWDARVLFVTPARQFPTGAVLSLERRQKLLRWADERDAVIVEDDYDSEFRHRGKSLEPLKVLDRGGRVVYVGSFTKTLLPGTRIGYAVLPPSLAEPFARAQQLTAGPYPVNLLEQKALAAFMACGEYERHLRRMKRLYSRKFYMFMQLVKTELGGWFDWVESDAGLHLFGWWNGAEEAYLRFRTEASHRGVRFAEAQTFSPEGTRYGVYLHFAHLSEDELREGCRRLNRALDALGSGSATAMSD
jgi:GntR family transcriptional regulator/MocR family aminotransferase